MTDDHPPAEMPIYEQVDESFHHVHDHMYIINDQVIECHNPGYGMRKNIIELHYKFSKYSEC